MESEKLRQTAAAFGTASNKIAIRNLETRFERVLVISEPLFGPVIPDDSLSSALSNLGGFDWVVFSDIRATDHFLEMTESFGFDLHSLDETMVCAVGEAVADRLRFDQIHSDVIPTRTDPDTVLAQMESYSGGIEGAAILIVETEDSPFSPGNVMSGSGGTVTRSATCRLEAKGAGLGPKETALLLGGGVDAFYFGEPSDVFDAALLLPGRGAEGLEAIANYFCGDLRTRGALSELGLSGSLLPLHG